MKIVVIEDQDDNREMIGMILGDRYEVSSYPNGRDGLQAIRQRLPDVVLLDVAMPDMNGVEVVGEIRSDSVLCDLRVIAVTAHAMKGDRERFLAAGFDEYVSKPITDIDAFRNLVERYFKQVNPESSN